MLGIRWRLCPAKVVRPCLATQQCRGNHAVGTMAGENRGPHPPTQRCPAAAASSRRQRQKQASKPSAEAGHAFGGWLPGAMTMPNGRPRASVVRTMGSWASVLLRRRSTPLVGERSRRGGTGLGLRLRPCSDPSSPAASGPWSAAQVLEARAPAFFLPGRMPPSAITSSGWGMVVPGRTSCRFCGRLGDAAVLHHLAAAVAHGRNAAARMVHAALEQAQDADLDSGLCDGCCGSIAKGFLVFLAGDG